MIRNKAEFDYATEQPDKILKLFRKQLLVRLYSAERIKDALGVKLKLIVGRLFYDRPSDTYALIRSMGLYVFGKIYP